MGARRIEALMNGLPFDGALARAYDPEHLGRGWSTETELLAVIAELVDLSNRYFVAANKDRSTQMPEPVKIPRPWAKAARRQSSPKQLKAYAQSTGGAIIVKRKKGKRA